MQCWYVTHRKKLEKVDFVDEEFLDKKANKNGVYIRIIVSCRRYSRRYMYQGTASVSLVLWRFESIELKEVTNVLQLSFR